MRRVVVSSLRPSGSRAGLGQHFLRSTSVVFRMIAVAGVRREDTVLEIGAGTGNLTRALLGHAGKVVAIELDGRLVPGLRELHGNGELEILQGDCMKLEWPSAELLIANIPYQVSSPVVFRMLEHRPRFRCAVLMLQEEFVRRLVAGPGEEDYSRLSVSCQLLANVEEVMKVGRRNFDPPPNVDSAVVKIEPKNRFLQWISPSGTRFCEYVLKERIEP